MRPFTCPLTGEVFDDLNGFVEHYLFLISQRDRINAALRDAKAHAGSLVEGEELTQRYREGDTVIKVTRPELSWDQDQLTYVLHTWPQMAEALIKPKSYSVSARGYDMLLRTSGDENFLEFREALKAACRGRVGFPHLSVEHFARPENHDEHTGTAGGQVPAAGDPLEAPDGQG